MSEENTGAVMPEGTPVKAKSTKKLSNIEFKYGALALKSGQVVYAVKLSGKITDATTSTFGSFGGSLFGGKSEDEAEPELVNTVLLANVNKSTGAVETVEITESADLYGWVTGSKEAKYELPTYLNDTLRNIVGQNMSDFKGIIKEFKPLTDESVELFKESSIVTEAMEEFTKAAVELTKAVEAAKKSGGNIGLDGFINRYAFNNHILLAGPRGVGKTYKVTQYADEHHAEVVQLNGHNGIEAIDVLGYNTKDDKGNFIWLDGPLTEAFRLAQTGQVILIIDELLRIKSRELNIFISALTPNASKQFVLNTSRVIDVIDGVGRTEVLKVPMENLWVVATTNVGSDYDTDDIDLALADRFITFDVLMQESVIHAILSNVNAENHNFDEAHVNTLVTFFNKIEGLVKAQELPHGINTRHLSKVIQLAKDPKEFKSYLFDFVANVVSRQTDGNLNEAEVKIYKDTLIAVFGK